MVLKIYGHPHSGNSQSVLVVLEELKVPYELVLVDMGKFEYKSPEHKKKQPFGQIPVMDDDGLILYESRAICRYLVARCNSPLVPSDLRKLALFEQAASIEYSNFNPYASKATFEGVVKKYLGLEADQEALKQYLKNLDDKLQSYDAILATQKYLAGDEITLADLFHLPYGSRMEVLQTSNVEDTKIMYKYKNVERWWKDITSRASWQVVMEEVKKASWR